MSFRIDLEIFRGPIDLLHFLVRKNEIEITQLSLSKITRQFQEYLDVLQEIDINQVGDFIEVASQLVEIKTRIALPRNEHEPEEADDSDPREDLVERLLVYKEFKETASLLEEQGRQWQQRYTRSTDDLPPRQIDIAEQPIHEVELWDLVSAFGRVLRDNRPKFDEKVFYDETADSCLHATDSRPFKNIEKGSILGDVYRRNAQVFDGRCFSRRPRTLPSP